jgi:Mg2+ and Co2+ transporter CorA
MNLDDVRFVINRIEPIMDHFAGSFEELEAEAEHLSKQLERTFHSDIADIEALLLAALRHRLKRRLEEGERRRQMEECLRAGAEKEQARFAAKLREIQKDMQARIKDEEDVFRQSAKEGCCASHEEEWEFSVPSGSFRIRYGFNFGH